MKIGTVESDQSCSLGCAKDMPMRDASHLQVSEGRRTQFNDVRGGIAVGCLHLLCEGRRTQVDVRTHVFETEVVF